MDLQSKSEPELDNLVQLHPSAEPGDEYEPAPEHVYGQGTITRLPNGRHRVRLYDGKGNSCSHGTYATHEEAEIARSAGLQARERLGVFVSFAEFGESWLKLTAHERKNPHKDHSVWKTWIVGTPLGDTAVDAVTVADVERWLADAVQSKRKRVVVGQRERDRKTVSAQTVIHALGWVRRALANAVKNGHLKENPAKEIKNPKRGRKPKPKYLSTKQIAAVLALKLRPNVRAAFIVATMTGLRQGELAALRWADVEGWDDPSRPVKLTVQASWEGTVKTDASNREFYMLPAAADALRAWRPHWLKLKAKRRRGDLIFPSHDGTPYAKGYDWGWDGKLDRGKSATYMPGVRDRAGVPSVKWHDLRHTCASHLVMGTWTPTTWPLIQIRDYLGHTSIKITERYAHLDEEVQAAAIAAVGHRSITGDEPPPAPASALSEAPGASAAASRAAGRKPARGPGLASSKPVTEPVTTSENVRSENVAKCADSLAAPSVGVEPTTRGLGSVGEPLKIQALTAAVTGSVTGSNFARFGALARGILGAALDAREVDDAEVGALAEAVLDAAPEPVRLALRLAALDPNDPARGPLGLQLAAAVLAAATTTRAAVVA